MTAASTPRPAAPREARIDGKKPDHAWPPRFTKLHLVFDDGASWSWPMRAASAHPAPPRSRPAAAHQPSRLRRPSRPPAVFAFRTSCGAARRRSSPPLDQGSRPAWATGSRRVLYQRASIPGGARTRSRPRDHADARRPETRRGHLVRVSNDSDRYPALALSPPLGRNPRAVTMAGERIRHITVAAAPPRGCRAPALGEKTKQ